MNKILILDDEEALRILYDNELTEEVYRVLTLNNGSRHLEVIEQKRPDLILLALKLGENNDGIMEASAWHQILGFPHIGTVKTCI